MNKLDTQHTALLKRFAWSAAILCLGCCTIVPILILVGVTGAVSLGVYFELAAAGFFITSLLIFSYLALKNKQWFCKKECSCKDTLT